MSIDFCYKLASPPKQGQPVEKDFTVNEAFSKAQRGICSVYDYADIIYVLSSDFSKIEKGRTKEFLTQLRNRMTSVFKESRGQTGEIDKLMEDREPELDQILVTAIDTQIWKEMNDDDFPIYRPPWDSKVQNSKINQKFSQQKKDFYKFNIAVLFQIKKKKKGENPLTKEIRSFLDGFGLEYSELETESRSICGHKNAIMAGRFEDGIEKPKDPYTFYLHCLIGYEDAKHLGGSYLIAQRCQLDWYSIHTSNERMPQVIGRNEIRNGNSIFSQHHCPRSHIRTVRIKDEDGNPETIHRDSKVFTTNNFSPEANRSGSDFLNPEEGVFFLGFHKDPLTLEKMILSQLGNNESLEFTDGLLNHFRSTAGNILYVPSMQEITGKSLSVDHKPKGSIEKSISSLLNYHQVDYMRGHEDIRKDEKSRLRTNNHFYNYSRAGYLKRMSIIENQNLEVEPPSPRILRLVSKTFALWQDTWYYDRSQRQIPTLYQLMDQYENEQIFSPEDFIGQYLRQFKKSTGNQQLATLLKGKTNPSDKWLYPLIPLRVRNGLAIYFGLKYIFSTKEYGCRGPVKLPENDKDYGVFGANTFHLEPEDWLAGGEANLTFGQGKHLVEYLTEEEKRNNWIKGLNLSGHSGIGHVTAYLDDVFTVGLQGLANKFKAAAEKFLLALPGAYNWTSLASVMQGSVTHQPNEGPKVKDNKIKIQNMMGTYLALKGMQQYLRNYSGLAKELRAKLGNGQQASIESFTKLEQCLRHISENAPQTHDLQQGAQMVLSVFICLHITGEPVSIGRLDYALRNFKDVKQSKTQRQEIIDCFWLKVGEKANFNRGLFEDHQKWGNLAMGGNSSPYPQGASFNQWGHQLTIGGSKRNLQNNVEEPFHNEITTYCLKAARRIPVNAPCLGLRLTPETPQEIKYEAAKTMLAGGAHPIIINDEKVKNGFTEGGNYDLKKYLRQNNKIPPGEQSIWDNWQTEVKEEDKLDFTSDGCHEFLVTGKSWFWLGGGCVLEPLQYVINVGKNLFSSGPRFIHGMRKYFKWKELSAYQTYQQFEDEYFETFRDLMTQRYVGQLGMFGVISDYCPASLLNGFTYNIVERGGLDLYENGATYKLFSPQYTGVANLANSLWNIRKLVFEDRVTTLEEIRSVLLANWGDELEDPWVPPNLPTSMKSTLKERSDFLRQQVWRQPKFGFDKDVTLFGMGISHKLSQITRAIFEKPEQDMIDLLKRLTIQYGSSDSPFGFQYMPGCGTFENYIDAGSDMGASFDGRKKGDSIAQDYSPQNIPLDKDVEDPKYKKEPIETQKLIRNFNYTNTGQNDPQFFSGAVVDLNIDEDYGLDSLFSNINSFSLGNGPNIVTVTVCDRQKMEDIRWNTDRDLLRFRMGGWTEFGVAMFPHLMEQHIRRMREVPDKHQERDRPTRSLPEGRRDDDEGKGKITGQKKRKL